MLKATELGVGTVFLAGTINRKAFEAAMAVGEDEVLFAVTPLGYPAEKRSIRESVMRKSLGSDKRLPFEKVFFKDNFSQPLAEDARYALPLEMVRSAPSATNKQPWRLVVCDNKIHFFEKKTKGYSNEKTRDIQKVDMGIAMAHFELGAEEAGIHGEWKIEDPGIACDADTEYIVTFVVM